MCSRRRFLSHGITLCTAALISRSVSALAAPRRVYVQPFGSGTSSAQGDFVERSLLAFYDVEVVRLAPIALPKTAFYPPRRRYRAERLLAALGELAPTDAYRILGVTDSDISTTKGDVADWGVMGLGSLDGKTCVLSSFRCHRGARNDAHATIRLGKTAVHELGHTFGLPHCPTRGCIMEDGHGTVFTSDREYDLCSTSRLRLLQTGHALAHDGEIPWPRPA
jgi:archaemetzincin